MKKLSLLFCVALAVWFVSCKSTEQVAEEPAKTQPVQEVKEETPAQEETEVDNGDSMSAVEAARKAALDAGAKDAYSDAFAVTDAAFEALKALNDGKDHSKELAEIKARYDALAYAAKARKLKARIDNEGLASNSQADYDAGEKALSEFDSMVLVPVTPGAALNKKAKEAYDSYYAVFFKSYKKFAINARKEAIAQKKAADAVKAQIARKEEYKSYANLILKGDQQFSTSNPEGALNSYKEAASSFEALAKDVAAKRAEAQKALDEAKAKVKASSDYAEKADVEKPLGDEAVAGIEAEDTVLLEKDEFESPDKEIIQIDENVQGAN